MALVGRPNVGKSSLLNRLAREERAVVDSVAGTTVDPVDSLVQIGGETWQFVDTAGLRKRVGQASGTEYYASLRTAGAIEAAEVAVVLLDASEPISEQDQRVLSMVVEAGRALVIAFNKWDLVDEDRRYYLDKEIERELRRIPWAIRLNLSAKTGRAVDKLAPALRKALASWETPGPDRPAQPVAHRAGPGHPAPGTRWTRPAHPVRHPGGCRAAAVRALHHRSARRRATSGSSSASSARSSASRAARSRSPYAPARSSARAGAARPTASSSYVPDAGWQRVFHPASPFNPPS